jgi:succinyl-diaminopimelate desuccinylase
VRVHGRPAHGSLPHKGINALEKMSALVRAFGRYKRVLARRTWKTPEGKLHRPTVNLGGVFHCGDGAKINTVPALASFTVDRRVLPIENHAAAERELRAFIKAAALTIPRCTVSIHKISENYSCFSEPTHPIFTAMADCVTGVRREKTRFNVSTGFNDMHFFSHHLKIPTIGYGPGGVDYHGVDERANVKELLASAKIYAQLMTTFAG